MAPARPSRPGHLPVLALALLVWHAALAADYLALRFAPDAGWPGLLPLMPAGALWVGVAWALGVWLGLAGAVFLALRDDASVLFLFAAMVAMTAAQLGLAGAAAPERVFGLPWPAVSIALAVVPLAGWLYARAQKRRGILH